MNLKQINKGYAKHQNDRIYDVGGGSTNIDQLSFRTGCKNHG